MYTKDNIVLHIPHSSRYIIPEYRNLFLISENELKEELLRMTDSYTDILFRLPLPSLVFPVSRLQCDVERFREKDKEEMSEKGMWICYEMTSDQRPLKRPTDEYVSHMLNLYDTHYRNFNNLVDEKLRTAGRCLIIDCHSFSSKKLPYEMSTAERPDICIGKNSGYHEFESDYLLEAFRSRGYKTVVNSPYSGSVVPEKYYRKNPLVVSEMIEVNRALYMDERTGEKTRNFNHVKRDIYEIIMRLHY